MSSCHIGFADVWSKFGCRMFSSGLHRPCSSVLSRLSRKILRQNLKKKTDMMLPTTHLNCSKDCLRSYSVLRKLPLFSIVQKKTVSCSFLLSEQKMMESRCVASKAAKPRVVMKFLPSSELREGGSWSRTKPCNEVRSRVQRFTESNSRW